MSDLFRLEATGEFSGRSNDESSLDSTLNDLFRRELPIHEPQWNHHLQAYLKRHTLMRLMHFAELYQEILEVPGDLLDFGVQYGASTATLVNLRGIYEPFNVSRNVVAFDTFEGLRGVSERDGDAVDTGYSVPRGYGKVLAEILRTHEQLSPIGHIKRTFVYEGDARETVKTWLEDFPGSPIALLHLDMDLFDPTLRVLSELRGRLFVGSVVVLDEMTARFFPGETQAVSEVFGLNNLRLRRTRFQPYAAWFRVE